MAQADAEKFVKQFLSDKSLRARMKAAKNDAEKKSIAKGLGLVFTQAELEQAYKASKELSDSELDSVAGGSSAVWVGIGVGGVGAVAGVAAAFASCGW